MVSTLILPIIAKISNEYLQCDPEMQQRLNPYNGRVLRATITTFDWSFYIKIHNQQLEFIDEDPGFIDAAFKAGISALTKAALSEKAGISAEIELHGDTAMIQTIINIFKQVEIDWEECIANYTGDAIAHSIGNVARGIKAFHQKIFATNRLNIKEYLQEEVNLLISPFAIDDFCKDVDNFRDEVERITAKISLIENYDKEN